MTYLCTSNGIKNQIDPNEQILDVFLLLGLDKCMKLFLSINTHGLLSVNCHHLKYMFLIPLQLKTKRNPTKNETMNDRYTSDDTYTGCWHQYLSQYIKYVTL